MGDDEVQARYGWTSSFEPSEGAILGRPERSPVKDEISSDSIATFIATSYRIIDGGVTGKPGMYYCNPCQQAARDTSYLQRIADLFGRAIWCSGCEDEHFPICFPHSQRHIKSWEGLKYCHGYVGSLRLCSHVSLKWADLVNQDLRHAEDDDCEETLQGVWKTCIRCKHPEHDVETGHEEHTAPPTLEVMITQSLETVYEFNFRQVQVVDVPFTTGTGINHKDNNLDNNPPVYVLLDACVAQIRQGFDSGNIALCPHMRADLDRLRSSSWTPTSTALRYMFGCESCAYEIYCEVLSL